jgi:hypothetical protein
VPGNVGLILFVTGFAVGAGSIVALGVSLLEDYPRERVLPATVGGALAAGALVGWALTSFFRWASSPTGM